MAVMLDELEIFFKLYASIDLSIVAFPSVHNVHMAITIAIGVEVNCE